MVGAQPMISFMVLGGPRSATTWLANLLTTDNTLCLHDPLLEHQAHALDHMQIPNKRVGIADTSALLYPDWLEQHRAKKIVLWRDPAEFNVSLRELGLRELDGRAHAKRIADLPRGIQVFPWQSVFHQGTAKEICKLFDVPFCRWRFEELKKMNIQPQWNRLSVGKEAVRDLVRRLAKELES